MAEHNEGRHERAPAWREPSKATGGTDHSGARDRRRPAEAPAATESEVLDRQDELIETGA